MGGSIWKIGTLFCANPVTFSEKILAFFDPLFWHFLDHFWTLLDDFLDPPGGPPGGVQKVVQKWSKKWSKKCQKSGSKNAKIFSEKVSGFAQKSVPIFQNDPPEKWSETVIFWRPLCQMKYKANWPGKVVEKWSFFDPPRAKRKPVNCMSPLGPKSVKNFTKIVSKKCQKVVISWAPIHPDTNTNTYVLRDFFHFFSSNFTSEGGFFQFSL